MQSFIRNLLAAVAAAAIVASTLIANGAEPVHATKTASSCPKGAAIAQRTVIDSDGTIHIITRCVAVSK